MRKILLVTPLTLILIMAAVLAGVAAGLYTYFESDKAVAAQGPRIELDELAFCTAAVIDLDRIEIALPNHLALLPGPKKELRISTQPRATMNAVLLPREEVDAILLGSNTCLISFDTQTWSITRSAVGQPWLQIDQGAGLSDFSSGESVVFDVGSVFNSTLIIEFETPDASISMLLLDAEFRYPDAEKWALGCIIAAGLLLVLFVILVVMVIMRNRHGSRSIEVRS
ncbi:MAG: hypothetical protein OSA11_01355 [Candidatus Nanopelagicales bacterium]|nr:hypothetical protein [Candidatus Nanopelagicales bacterium]